MTASERLSRGEALVGRLSPEHKCHRLKSARVEVLDVALVGMIGLRHTQHVPQNVVLGSRVQVS